MIEIVFNNVNATITGGIHHDPHVIAGFHDAMRKELSYMSEASSWSDKFKNNKWDGRISLYNKYTSTYPTGLLSRSAMLMSDLGFDFKLNDKRKRPEPNIHVETLFHKFGRKLYFYQEEAARLAKKSTRGIIAIGTGGGKTYTSCEIIKELSCAPVVFVVPSKSLLHQTYREFSKLLKIDGKPAVIGRVGDDICEINPQGINICTYQSILMAYSEVYVPQTIKDKHGKVIAAADTVVSSDLVGNKKSTEQVVAEYEAAEEALKKAITRAEKKFADLKGRPRISAIAEATAKARAVRNKCKIAFKARTLSVANKEQIRDLIANCLVYMVDETHIAAVIIEHIGKHARSAYYRFGISATPYREDRQEIRIEGTFGKTMIHVPSSDLIKLGLLVKPYIVIVEDDYVELAQGYADAYDKHIINNWDRNYRIKQFAEEFKERGWPTLIFVDQLDHGRILETMIQDSVFVSGSDEGDDMDFDHLEEETNYRQAMLDRAQNNEIILIATSWVNTGIDAPKIQAMIFGGAIASMSTTMQMIGRGLRLAPGKDFTVIVDFDSAQKNLHKQAVARRKAYQNESEYEVIRIK